MRKQKVWNVKNKSRIVDLGTAVNVERQSIYKVSGKEIIYKWNGGKRIKRIYKRVVRKEEIVKIGYINMQGGRKPEKWLELNKAVKDEGLEVLAVVETHLREEEEPILEDLVWQGINRNENEKRGGGIGVMSKKYFNTVKCQEHMWFEIRLGRQEWMVAIVYIATGDSQAIMEWNSSIYECLVKDIQGFKEKGKKIMIIGDMNGHIEEIDGVGNKNGQLLKNFCQRVNLSIGNLLNVYEGQYTWSRNNIYHTIDYVLVEKEGMNNVRKIKVFDNEERVCNSDHNFFIIEMVTNVMQNRNERSDDSERCGWRVNDKSKLEEYKGKVEESMDDFVGDEYKNWCREIENVANRVLGENMQKNKRNKSMRVSESVKERKKACREYKCAIKNKEGEKDINDKWRKYLEKKKLAKIDNYRERMKLNSKLLEDINKSGRDGSKKFWRYIKRRNVGEREIVLLDDEGLESSSREKIELILNKYVMGIERMLDVKERVVANLEAYSKDSIRFTENELNEAGKKLRCGKARGLDGWAGEMVMNLGCKAKVKLLSCFNRMVQKRDFPDSWSNTRVRLLFKGKGKDHRRLNNYRPIAVTSVLYKVFAYMVAGRVVEWMEESNIVGEMQGGFRSDRRIGDSLFVVTQLMDMSRYTGKQLYMAFIDIEKAYDRVNRDRLWVSLVNLGMDGALVDIIKKLYENNHYIYQLGNIKSIKVKNGVGLRQGCPMSPILFLLYLTEMERAIEKLGRGIEIPLIGAKGVYTLSGLLFADDVFLCAEKREDMEAMLRTCARVGEEMGVKFSEEKSKVMMINSGEKEDSVFLLGDIKLSVVNRYNYLGVVLSNQINCLEEWEKRLMNEAKKRKGLIKKLTVFSYNKYDVARIVWKGVGVAALTYGNDALCVSKGVLDYLEKVQREVGRHALDADVWTAKEAIQGEMGWSSFYMRDAKSKMKMFGRLQFMDDKRIAKIVFNWVMNKGRVTRWVRKVMRYAEDLDKEFVSVYLYKRWDGCIKRIVECYSNKEWDRRIDALIKNRELDRWRASMESKKCLNIYRSKRKIGCELIYDNSRESSLLFKARTGSLATADYTRKWKNVDDLVCKLCKEGIENIRHLLIECKCLQTERVQIIELWRSKYKQIDYTENGLLTFMLGLAKDKGDLDIKTMSLTKIMLWKWDKAGYEKI